MSFYKRHITNKKVISLYREGGVGKVLEQFKTKADAFILQNGIASKIGKILNDDDWKRASLNDLSREIEFHILDQSKGDI